MDLLIFILNYLQVKCINVINTYITAPVEEKIWTNIGPKFGLDTGKRSLVVRDLYGLKFYGYPFWAHLRRCMHVLGYEPCLADPNLWIKSEVRPNERYEYYSYILCYLYHIMVVHHAASIILTRIDKYLTLKASSIGETDIYLGAKLRKMTLPNGVW